MKYNSIKLKITMLCLMIAVVSSTLLTIYGTFRSLKIAQEVNTAYIETLSNEHALAIDGFLLNQKGYLEGQVQSLIHTKDYSQPFMATFTKNLVSGNNSIAYSYFNTLKDNGHFTSSDGWMPPMDYTWENKFWLELVKETPEIFVDAPSYDTVTGKIVTVLRKRVLDKKVEGILNIAINLDVLSDTINNFKMPKDSYAFLVDSKGVIISYCDMTVLSGVEEAPNINSIIEGFTLEASKFQINETVYIKKDLGESDWILYLAVPKSLFSKGVYVTVLRFMLIYGLIMILVIAFSYVFGKRLSKPIVSLTNLAETIIMGSYDVVISEDLILRKDEIGELARTFNKMMGEIINREKLITNYVNEIKKNNEELETKVEKRTHELLEMNQFLEKALQDLKEAQEQLILSENIESLGNLVARVAHEMNTPLGNVLTTVTYLQNESRLLMRLYENHGMKKSDLTKYFEITKECETIIYDNISKGNNLIKTFKMLSGEYISSVITEVNVLEVINEVLLVLKEESKKHKIEYELSCDKSIFIRTVSYSLQYVITHLISNCIFHAYEDGGIIKISLFELNQQVFVVVKDYGKGISEEYGDQIFKPFFTTKRNEGRMGLGLSIAFNGIKHNLKGDLTYTSKKNEGTEFTLSLPYAIEISSK